MKKEHMWLAAGYLLGSFFGVQQVLGIFTARVSKPAT